MVAIFLTFLASLGQLVPQISLGAEAQGKIDVTLFGQPCVLVGPFDRATLQRIHEISPEQAQDPESLVAAKKLEAKLSNSKGIPELLKNYQEKLLKRAQCSSLFFEAIKKPQPEKMLNKCMKKPMALEEWTTKGAMTEAQIVTLYESFLEKLDPKPEETFHTALRKLKIQYQCSFDEAE